MTTYRVVAAPVAVQGMGEKANLEAVQTYSQMINKEAQAGWKFVCFDSTTVNRTDCGCSTTSYVIKLLVFAKDG